MIRGRRDRPDAATFAGSGKVEEIKGAMQEHRSDIVVFDEPETGTRLIKRVVAIGGDVVEVRAGHVFIDGRLQPADPANLQFGGGPDVPPILVPAGQVLALGDSRGNSRDGRWFGFVPVSALYAKALRVYYRSEQGLVWLPL